MALQQSFNFQKKCFLCGNHGRGPKHQISSSASVKLIFDKLKTMQDSSKYNEITKRLDEIDTDNNAENPTAIILKYHPHCYNELMRSEYLSDDINSTDVSCDIEVTYENENEKWFESFCSELEQSQDTFFDLNYVLERAQSLEKWSLAYFKDKLWKKFPQQIIIRDNKALFKSDITRIIEDLRIKLKQNTSEYPRQELMRLCAEEIEKVSMFFVRQI